MRCVRTSGYFAAVLLAAGIAEATPSTNIWNPSTDIQAKGVVHLGIDNYFSVLRNQTTPVSFGTDIGITYGLGAGFEIGVDIFEPSVNPVVFNAKWGLGESKDRPAFALGIQSVGTNAATQGNIIYALLSKNVGDVGRFTAGGYLGRAAFVGSDNAGAILAWDRAFGDKWWACVDWASGNNGYGALALGGSYRFSDNVGLIVGYVFFNDHGRNINDTFTTQLDVDF